MPVHEAIVNSIDAIEERGGDGEIEVRIYRNPDLFEEDPHGNYILDIRDIEIRDTGIGFTDGNFRSFCTLDSLAKADKGGKGIGRLLWLKAFESAVVESVFRDDGEVEAALIPLFHNPRWDQQS